MQLTDQAKEHYSEIIDELSEAAATLSGDAYLGFIEALNDDIQDHFLQINDGRKALPLLSTIREDRAL